MSRNLLKIISSSTLSSSSLPNKKQHLHKQSGTTYFTAGRDLYHKLLERLPATDCERITEDDYPPLTYVLKNEAGEKQELLIPQEVRGGMNCRGCSLFLERLQSTQ